MNEVPDQEVKQFLIKKGMKINGNYVNPPKEEKEKVRFELNQDRIEQLTEIVKFLEKQEYSFN